MATKKKVIPAVYRYPGTQQLQKFLEANSKLFNFSELERICELPGGTLRHISAGSRPMDPRQYERLKDALLPKLYEIIFLLQHHN